jgi:glycosyltransferase involved in cell wall biosynthesis
MNALNIVMALTDGFGGFGGISRFNRDFLVALDASPQVTRVWALPRLIQEPIEELIPESVVYDRRAARGKVSFILRALTSKRRGDVNLVICAHLHLLPVAWLMSKIYSARLVLMIYGIEAWFPPRNGFSRMLVRQVDSFISISSYSTERFLSWAELNADRGFILAPCVDLKCFKPGSRDQHLISRYGLSSSRVLMTVGRLASQERYKGFDEILESFPLILARIPNVKYVIIGDGRDRRRLELKSAALGLSDKVIFAGRIPESEKVAHYNLADVYVMPSAGEGFGIALIEAAACGVPVIGSAVDGSSEALLEGRLGRLVDPRKPDDVVDAIVQTLEQELPRRRHEAVETFSVPNFRKRVAQWVDSQLAA